LISALSLQRDGNSMRSIASELHKRKVETPRGGAWHPQLVTTGDAVAEATETRVCVKLDPSQPKKILGQLIPDDLRAAFNHGDAAPSER
jgi:hypothetical protein